MHVWLTGSVGDPITGWLQCFFPYLNYKQSVSWGRHSSTSSAPARNKLSRNDSLDLYRLSMEHDVNVETFDERQQNCDGSFDAICGRGILLKDIPPSTNPIDPSLLFPFADF
jgi:hypothetical protein